MLSDLFSFPIYVRVARNEFRLRNIRSNVEVSTSSKVPFTTRRLLIGQFSVAEETLKLALKEAAPAGLFAPSPHILIHPLEMTEDGLSQVEERVFREIAAAAGASKVRVWIGPELVNSEVIAKLKKS